MLPDGLSSSNLAMSSNDELELPPMVAECWISRFKYWDQWDQDVRAAMRYQGKLYIHLEDFQRGDRGPALDRAYGYAQAGHRVCLTVSAWGYALWKAL